MIKLNLIQKKRKASAVSVFGIQFSDFNIKWLIFALLIFYGSGLYDDFLKEEIEKVNAVVQKRTSQELKIRKELRKNRNIKDKLKAYNEKIIELKKRQELVQGIIQLRTNPKNLLERIAVSIPNDVWLDSLLVSENKKIKLKGKSYSYKSIGSFINSTNESVFFNNSMKLISADTKKLGDERTEIFEIEGNVVSYGN